MKHIVRYFLVAISLALSFGAAMGQTPAPRFPVKPIRLIVPFPGGSASDTIARALAEQMSPLLGQRIVVEPMPGAGSVIGIQYAIRQPADGYTMVMLSNASAIKSASLKPPFDIRKDLAMVGEVLSSTFYLAVNKDVPVKSVQELVDYARANPGKLNISSYGNGTVGHLTAELFMKQTGTKMVHVPFAGSTANALALAQGTTQVTFDNFASLRPHVERGSIRLLGITSPSRSPEAPEVPTMRETPSAAFTLVSVGGVAVPAGTPPEIVETLGNALATALKQPAMISFFQRTGFGEIAKSPSPQSFTAVVNHDVDVFGKLIRDAKIELD